MAECTVLGTVRYGDVLFSFLPMNMTIESTPMKADDGTSIKYNKVKVSIDAIISVDNPNLTQWPSIDVEMDFIREQLNTRGLSLDISYRGYGQNLTCIPSQDDVVYGPHPQVHSWEPLGNNLTVRVRWSVEWARLECEYQTVSSLPAFPNPWNFKILQLVETNDLSFNESGACVLTTSGTIEVASGSVNPLSRERLKQFVRLFLPNQLLQFQRTTSMTVRKDHRTVDYRVVDTEVESDNPMFPFMVKQDVSHEISSTLLDEGGIYSTGGFRKWISRMNGEFTVRPGVWKGYAWFAFCVAMNQRRNRIFNAKAVFGNDVKVVDEEDTADVPTPSNKDEKAVTYEQVPLQIKIKEDLFARTVSCSVTWWFTTTLLELFRTSGMFTPVYNGWQGVPIGLTPDNVYPNPSYPPLDATTQWSLWKAQLSSIQTPGGFKNPVLPNFSLLFGVCESDQLAMVNERYNYYDSDGPNFANSAGEGFEISTEWERNALGGYDKLTKNGTSTSNYLNRIEDPGATYVAYDNRIRLTEITNSTYVPTLDPQQSVSRRTSSSQAETTLKDNTGFKINGNIAPQNSGAYQDELIQVRGKPVYMVNMAGFAVRVGFQPAAPVLLGTQSFGNSLNNSVYRIGINEWETQTISTSQEIPVFLLKWNLDYALINDPSASNIVYNTTGKPAEYV